MLLLSVVLLAGGCCVDDCVVPTLVGGTNYAGLLAYLPISLIATVEQANRAIAIRVLQLIMSYLMCGHGWIALLREQMALVAALASPECAAYGTRLGCIVGTLGKGDERM